MDMAISGIGSGGIGSGGGIDRDYWYAECSRDGLACERGRSDLVRDIGQMHPPCPAAVVTDGNLGLPLSCVDLRCVALRGVALRCVALHCVALRRVVLRCVALRCVCEVVEKVVP